MYLPICFCRAVLNSGAWVLPLFTIVLVTGAIKSTCGLTVMGLDICQSDKLALLELLKPSFLVKNKYLDLISREKSGVFPFTCVYSWLGQDI